MYLKKKELVIGSNFFPCTNGSYISYLYLCDGIIDCESDQSDEMFEVCSKISHPAIVRNTQFYNITCSSLYYRTPKGHCKKYIKDNKHLQNT